jgi:hypothetical protein
MNTYYLENLNFRLINLSNLMPSMEHIFEKNNIIVETKYDGIDLN